MLGIQELREQAGLTQEQLAIRSGVARPNIAAYESGKRKLTPQMRDRLQQALKTPTASLRQHRNTVRGLLESVGGRNIRVFGSVASRDDTNTSDLDLLVDFEPDSSLFQIAEVQQQLQELLGFSVDIVSSRALQERHAEILAEAVAL